MDKNVSLPDSSCAVPPGTPFFTIIYVLIVLFSILGNSSIIAVTFRPKSRMKSKSNRLIALLAIFDLMSSTGVGFWIVGAYLGILNCVSQTVCVYSHLPITFSINCGATLIAAIGLDRFLAIVFALSYRNWDSCQYLITMLLIPISVGIAHVVLAVQGLPKVTPQINGSVLIPMCIPPEAYGSNKTVFVGGNMICCLIVILIYVLDLIIAAKIHVSSAKQRMLVTMMIVMTMFAASWFLTVSVLSVTEFTDWTRTTKSVVTMYVGWGFGINLAFVCFIKCNGYIYAWRSTKYRKEFWKLFPMNRKRNTAIQSYYGTHQNQDGHPVNL